MKSIDAPAQDQKLSELLIPEEDEFERQWLPEVDRLLDVFPLGSRGFSACIAGMIGEKIKLEAAPKRQAFESLSKSQQLKKHDANELLYDLIPDEQRKRAEFVINIEKEIGIHEKLRE